MPDAASGNTDHVARMIHAALKEHLQSSGEKVQVSDINYSVGDWPCFWVDIDGTSVLVEASLWQPAEPEALAEAVHA